MKRRSPLTPPRNSGIVNPPMSVDPSDPEAPNLVPKYKTPAPKQNKPKKRV